MKGTTVSARAASPTSAAIILPGIEMVCIMRERQARYAFNPNPPLAGQSAILVA